MKTIVILAAGPPKKGRNRHLECFNGLPCITIVIHACSIDGQKICVAISKDNHELKDYLKNKHSNVKILETSDYSMLSTYKTAFDEDDNDKILVDGDLTNIKKDNIIKFINTEYRCAKSKLTKYRWGNDLVSVDRSIKRRGDIGGSILLIGNEYQSKYISNENVKKAKNYFAKFYPHAEFDMNIANHLDTWLKYTLFFDINNHIYNQTTELGLIDTEDCIWLDND